MRCDKCPFKVGDRVDLKTAFKNSDLFVDKIRTAKSFVVDAVEPCEGWPVDEWFVSLKIPNGDGEIHKFKACELVPI